MLIKKISELKSQQAQVRWPVIRKVKGGMFAS